MSKDIISNDTKWMNVIASFMLVYPIWYFLSEVVGKPWHCLGIALMIFVMDLASSLRLERLEQRVRDLEKL